MYVCIYYYLLINLETTEPIGIRFHTHNNAYYSSRLSILSLFLKPYKLLQGGSSHIHFIFTNENLLLFCLYIYVWITIIRKLTEHFFF